MAFLQIRRSLCYDCNMNATLQLNTALRAAGQSLTQPRRTVYEALQGQEPLSMAELVARCAAVDRASVYRTVTLFEQLGIVQRLQTGWKYKLELSSDFHEHHHHATCLSCGTSIVLPEDAALEELLVSMARAKDFSIERHQLELQGYCSACTIS